MFRSQSKLTEAVRERREQLDRAMRLTHTLEDAAERARLSAMVEGAMLELERSHAEDGIR